MRTLLKLRVRLAAWIQLGRCNYSHLQATQGSPWILTRTNKQGETKGYTVYQNSKTGKISFERR